MATGDDSKANRKIQFIKQRARVVEQRTILQIFVRELRKRKCPETGPFLLRQLPIRRQKRIEEKLIQLFLEECRTLNGNDLEVLNTNLGLSKPINAEFYGIGWK